MYTHACMHACTYIATDMYMYMFMYVYICVYTLFIRVRDISDGSHDCSKCSIHIVYNIKGT